MTMVGPDPVMVELIIAFILGAILSAILFGAVIGTSFFTGTPMPHCGVCVCP